MMKKRIVQIMVPLVILLAIGGIWMVKNGGEDFGLGNNPVADTNGSENQATGMASEDFQLEAKAIDLEALKGHGLPVIIDFGADSCEPCKKMAPVLVKLNEEMKGKAIIKFVDVWKNSGAAKDFPVQVIPTQVFIQADGTPYIPGDHLNIRFDIYEYRDTGEHAFTVHQGGLTEEELRLILEDMGAV
jgi:thioredoxin 1